MFFFISWDLRVILYEAKVFLFVTVWNFQLRFLSFLSSAQIFITKGSTESCPKCLYLKQKAALERNIFGMFISESEINWFLNAKKSVKFLNLGLYSYRQTNKQSVKGKCEKYSKVGNGTPWAEALDIGIIWLQEGNSWFNPHKSKTQAGTFVWEGV